MKTVIKKIGVAFLAITLLMSNIMNIKIVEANDTNVDKEVAQLISYYKSYQMEAKTDIDRVLSEMKEKDETAYEAWSKIMNYWNYVNTEMEVIIEGVPNDLAQDDSLAIVVLGFALNTDGTMKPELTGRLEAGLAIAEAYPNSYIVVTGGGTASGNPNVTEGGLMGDWLVSKGLDESRVIVEDEAPNTVGNAENTYKILSEKYPSVQSLVMVTSDYHVPRASLLYYSKCLLTAYETNSQPLSIVANVGSYTGSTGYESLSLQASGLASVAGVSESSQNPDLSTLTGLKITQADIPDVGDELALQVIAKYNSGFTRDITSLAMVTGYDSALGSHQTVEVSYTENGVTISTPFNLKKTSHEVADKTYLINIITSVKNMNLTIYTQETVDVLMKAVDDANRVVESENATAEDILNAYNTIKEAETNLILMPNVAYKMNVEANCNQTNAYKITDGVISTSNYWASEDNGNVPANEAEFIIDLNGSYQVENIVVYPYYGGKRVYQYDVFGSTDKENWNLIAQNTSDDYATSEGFIHEVDEEVNYVKLVGVKTIVEGRPDINNLHIIEMQVYGEEVDNLAYRKPVVSSGTDTSAGSSADSAETKTVDGDVNTYWDAGKYNEDPWITVDLEDVYLLEEVVAYPYFARNDRYYYYDIYTSIDGKNYTQIYSKNEGTDKTTIFGDPIDLRDQEIYARYVKLVGQYNSANASFHLNELKVYGEEVNYEYISAKVALETKIEEAKNIDLSLLTKTSQEELEQTLQNAEEVHVDNDAKLETVKACTLHLTDIMNALEYLAAEYTKLSEALAIIKNINGLLYVNYDTLQSAIDEIVFGLDIRKQNEIDGWTQKIEEAAQSLVKKKVIKNSPLLTIDETVYKGNGFTIRIDQMIISQLQGVQVNGKMAVKDVDYFVQPGSVIIELSPAFVETLQTGEATIAIYMDEVIFETSIQVLEAKDSAPDTGDSTNVGNYFLLLLAGLAIITVQTIKS